MPSLPESSLDKTLVALADPTRRAILARLVDGEARMTEVAAPFGISLNAVSKHVRLLERAGLVHRQIQGREHRLSFVGAPLHEAGDWIDYYRRFWDARLAGLEQFLERRATEKQPKPKRGPRS
ncbi:MAG: metalloregulator ArsR/SmtB family transcription factor [Proteobacteria bacterium]|nr:metalloregulator ArsR/SmtB family transcription factor [Pseudomonadota bacterium]MDA1058391.1 metalloregulator ArsR/SmtB family transcription factor [Pseudomonadota bacterium]